MKPLYIQEFEKLGFGMFVHFGLYSVVGKGEWYYFSGIDCDKDYYFSNDFANKFNPKKDWAIKLVKQAKKAGMKYVTFTTKHHDGYCLYDAKGLTDWDSIHLGPKRDLVKEFVDACNLEGIVPFFYHAIYDWHHPDYETNFPKYIDYLIDSVALLCQRYGKIGGFWFDGAWNKPDGDWQFDRLYKTIRKYQPTAMIINNTGLEDEGSVGHEEIDSVTFERGTPRKVSNPDKKERAGEMCEVFGYHWGYTKDDLDRKSFRQILSSLIDCRYNNCNFLLNVGPNKDGYIIPEDKKYLNSIGYWLRKNNKFIYNVKNAEIDSNGCKVFKDDKYYYAVIEDVNMSTDPNVQRATDPRYITIPGQNLKGAIYLDNKEKVELEKSKDTFAVKCFYYGTSLYARVVRWKIKK